MDVVHIWEVFNAIKLINSQGSKGYIHYSYIIEFRNKIEKII